MITTRPAHPLDKARVTMPCPASLNDLSPNQIRTALSMHPFRTHTCGEPREVHAGETVRLSGWIHRKRDHGNLLFIDLRDHYGLTQCVVDVDSPCFARAEAARVESVLTLTGPVVLRSEDTINDKLPTGRVELRIDQIEVQSEAALLPLQVNADEDAGYGITLGDGLLEKIGFLAFQGDEETLCGSGDFPRFREGFYIWLVGDEVGGLVLQAPEFQLDEIR